MGAGHRMRADIATQLDIALPQGVEYSSLHRADVRHGCMRIDLQAVNNQIGNCTWRYRYDDKVDVRGHWRLDRAGAQSGCDPSVADLVVTQVYGVISRGKGTSDRCPDQAGPDDDDSAISALFRHAS